jgi:hypothetical protein
MVENDDPVGARLAEIAVGPPAADQADDRCDEVDEGIHEMTVVMAGDVMLPPMSRKTLLIVGGAVVGVIAVAALFLLVIAPSGGNSAQAAVLSHVSDRADANTAKVLTQQDWGDGQLVLVGYEGRGVRRLGIAFAAKQMRGWKVRSYTEESVEPDDVVVGSLLIASSEGGDGQPAWTAAVGELIDDRIERVEVKWAASDTSVGPRATDAYMVIERGVTTATEARYLADDGAEIARVPVDQN